MDMQDLDLEIGFPVANKIAGKDDIQAGELPTKIAICDHVGPYSDLAPAYEALSEWIKQNGYEATGVAYEMYLSDPDETPAAELMTQIVFPLRPR
jgi:effector-binding domain-containing protein